MSTDFLNAEEIERLQTWPDQLDKEDLVKYFTLSSDDRKWIKSVTRGGTNILGLALQLCCLPWLGFVPDEIENVPAAIAGRFEALLKIPKEHLRGYGARPETRRAHHRLVIARRGWCEADTAARQEIAAFLEERALEHESPVVLLRLACEYLKGEQIVRPTLKRLGEMVLKAKKAAVGTTYRTVEPLLTPEIMGELDDLLVIGDGETTSRLAKLFRGVSKASSAGIRAELDKLSFLRGLAVHGLDISVLPEARRRWLAQVGRRAPLQKLRELPDEERYPLLLATVAECAVEVLDEVLQMFDQALTGAESRARRKLDETLAARAREQEQWRPLLGDMLKIATEVPVTEVGARLVSDVGMDRMIAWLGVLAKPLYKDDGLLAQIDENFGYFREFAQHVVGMVAFEASGGSASIARAVTCLRDLYRSGVRKVPEKAPTDFVPDRWRDYLTEATKAGDSTAYRHYWELLVLLAVRGALRSGDLWVVGSRRYASPIASLMPVAQWEKKRDEFCRLTGVPPRPEPMIKKIRGDVREALKVLEPQFAAGKGTVRLDERQILRLDARLSSEDVPDPVRLIGKRLFGLLPLAQLAELLIEVDRSAGWSDLLSHATTGAVPRDDKTKQQLYAAVVAQACNFGQTAMAAASGISVDQLRRTTEQYLREDTLRAANNAIVNFQYSQPMARNLGSGLMSSSEGQRFPMRGKGATARALSRYATGEGLSTYTHVSDQHITFGVKVVPVPDKEAAYVLDELLGNKTDLPITEHVVDAEGQLLSTFGLFALTGFRLSPQFRSLEKVVLYSVEPLSALAKELPNTSKLFHHRVDLALIEAHWDEMLRLAASLKYGYVSASLIVARLNATSRMSTLAKALVEFGRLQRTVYALRYLTDESYRRRISEQLAKGRSVHELRKAVFFAYRDAARHQTDDRFEEQALCLTLVVNSIITWNTLYLELALEDLEGDARIDRDLLRQLSPAQIDHVNLYGKYEFPVKEEYAREGFRPLRS